jgi:hypothetical protein
MRHKNLILECNNVAASSVTAIHLTDTSKSSNRTEHLIVLMAEAGAALGLVASIIQLVDFAN